jgi:hypothetical protein
MSKPDAVASARQGIAFYKLYFLDCRWAISCIYLLWGSIMEASAVFGMSPPFGKSWGPGVRSRLRKTQILGTSTKCTIDAASDVPISSRQTRSDYEHITRSLTQYGVAAIGHSPTQSHFSKYLESLAFAPDTATISIPKSVVYLSSLQSSLRHLHEVLTGNAPAIMVHSAAWSPCMHLRLVAAAYRARTRTTRRQ